MKFIDEYRDPALARQLLAAIRAAVSRPWVIMEICGGHTHAIMRYGIDRLLPSEIELVHGPGCPVCVTPAELIDRAVALAVSDHRVHEVSGHRVPPPALMAAASPTAMRTPVREPARSPQDAVPCACLPLAARPEVIMTSFGDMLRVPGSGPSLLAAKAAGGDVRMVYSPLEAVTLARANPDRQVVFFAVGFETTAPGNAQAVLQAARLGLSNFSLLVSHVLVPPAIRALLAAPGNRVQGFLAAGHVCAVMGWHEYEEIAARYRTPIVPTGFEPLDLLAGILMVVRQLEAGEARVENEYTRVVRPEGNPAARAAVEQVFQVRDRQWRGLGVLVGGGLGLRDEYAAFDAERKFALFAALPSAPTPCISGEILCGRQKPPACPAFGRQCTPTNPLGATMVSSEGACAAYYAYRQEVSDHRVHEISDHRAPPVVGTGCRRLTAVSGTAMRTQVREPARSPQDAVPCDRLRQEG